MSKTSEVEWTEAGAHLCGGRLNGNLLFLGLGASALCFVIWKTVVKVLGSIKTGIYIYLVPVITMIAPVWILREKITVISGVSAVLTNSGLFFRAEDERG